MSQPPPPVFELADPVLSARSSMLADAASPHLLGLWAPVPTAPEAAIGFGVGDTGRELDGTDGQGQAPEAPVWRVNLPADVVQAATYLEQGEQRLIAVQQALPLARTRLRTLIAQRQGTGLDSAGRSFDLAARSALPPAETELLAAVDFIQTGGQQAPPPDALSFGGVGPSEQPEQASLIQQGMQQVQDFARQVLQTVAHYAWVETRIEGHLLGRTVVGWTGSMETIWAFQPAMPQVALHGRMLDLALASRTALVRMFVMVMQGAVQMTVLVANPAGALLMVPAVWKFFNRVIAEKT